MQDPLRTHLRQFRNRWLEKTLLPPARQSVANGEHDDLDVLQGQKRNLRHISPVPFEPVRGDDGRHR